MNVLKSDGRNVWLLMTMVIQALILLKEVEPQAVTPSSSLPSPLPSSSLPSPLPSSSLPSPFLSLSLPSPLPSSSLPSPLPSSSLPSPFLSLSLPSPLPSSSLPSPFLSLSLPSPLPSSSLHSPLRSSSLPSSPPSSSLPSPSPSSLPSSSLPSPLLSSPPPGSTTQAATPALLTTTSASPATTSPPAATTTIAATISSPSPSVSVTPASSPSSSSPSPLSSSSLPGSTTQAATPALPSASSASLATTSPPAASTTITATASSPSPSVSVTPASQNGTTKPLYIQMTFSMPWGRFCYLISLFKESLSRDLIEFKGVQYATVQPQRIKLMNANDKCSNRTHYNDQVILQFYIEEDLVINVTDREMTIKAFKLLHGYWVNKRMGLLDKVFEGKVTNVELIGADASEYVEKYTEAQRIGIAIGVALAILLLLLIIIFCTKGYGVLKGTHDKPEEKKMIFTNTLALEEDTVIESGHDSQPQESQAQPRDEPKEVVIHHTKKSEPVTKAQDETPLLSAVKDYEDGKKVDETKSDEQPGDGAAPLAKPEPDNNSEGEPIKPPDETEADAAPEEAPPVSEAPVTDEPAKAESEGTGEPAKAESEGTGEPDKPEEEGIGERKATFTSSVTILITPDATSTPATFEYPATENPPEKGKEDVDKQVPEDAGEASAKENVRPDFGQSDNADADPNQGAINLGFDDKDEAAHNEKEKEEETKF